MIRKWLAQYKQYKPCVSGVVVAVVRMMSIESAHSTSCS